MSYSANIHQSFLCITTAFGLTCGAAGTGAIAGRPRRVWKIWAKPVSASKTFSLKESILGMTRDGAAIHLRPGQLRVVVIGGVTQPRQRVDYKNTVLAPLLGSAIFNLGVAILIGPVIEHLHGIDECLGDAINHRPGWPGFDLIPKGTELDVANLVRTLFHHCVLE